MMKSSLSSRSAASTSGVHISSLMRPARTSSLLTRASAHSRRVAISEPDISSEKNMTVVPAFAAFTASDSANDVLPTPGRAPTMLSEPGRMPSSTLSRSRKPVATPAMWPGFRAMSWISA